MKIKVTTVEEVELDITYPYYSKSNCYTYKVISDTKMIEIVNAFYGGGIEITSMNIQSAFAANCEQITADEFNTVFFNELERITKSIEDVI